MQTNWKNLPAALKAGALGVLLSFSGSTLFAGGVYVDGVGARSMSMGGADVAYAIDPLGAMGANPAALGFQTAMGADFGFVGGWDNGEFTKSSTSSGGLHGTLKGLPEGAFALPIGKLTLGFSLAPTAMANADWAYNDPPGGANGTTSYGPQINHSRLVVLRSAVGAGYAINDQLSLGASFGVNYNHNELQTPYIFQATPALAGAKTLLNLRTDGIGYDGQIGLMYRPLTNLSFGLAYRTETQVDSRGDAYGNVGPQFGVANIPFHYDARVRNIFPQLLNVGGSWGFAPKWRMALQVDWVGWHSAFKTLPVMLSNGNNPTVNAVAGTSSPTDSTPLHWEDQFVYRAGFEYEVIHNLFLRAGYSYGRDPVPDNTLTPLTAAETEHTLTAGVGYKWHRYAVDLAYQYDISITRQIGTSALLSGEYSGSSVKVGAQVIALTFGATF